MHPSTTFGGFSCCLVVTCVLCFFKFQKLRYTSLWCLNNTVMVLRHFCFFLFHLHQVANPTLSMFKWGKHIFLSSLYASFGFRFTLLIYILVSLDKGFFSLHSPQFLHETALRNPSLGFLSPFLFLLVVQVLTKCWSNLKVLRKGKKP